MDDKIKSLILEVCNDCWLGKLKPEAAIFVIQSLLCPVPITDEDKSWAYRKLGLHPSQIPERPPIEPAAG